MIELDESHVTLGKTSCQQAVGRKSPRFPSVFTVKRKYVIRFSGSVRQFGDTGLHPERHLILRDAGLDFGIANTFVQILCLDPKDRSEECVASHA